MMLPAQIKQLYFEQVWALVEQIPFGRVATYGQIAKILSRPEAISHDDYQIYASRWVGLAMAASPENLPWHRVINAQGKISPRPEAETQKQRLEEEGVVFSNYKLGLKEYQWHGPGQSEDPAQGRLF